VDRLRLANGSRAARFALGVASMLLAVLLSSAASAAGGGAGLKLESVSASLTLTSETEWSLAKTGSVNTTNSTVTWTISATQGATTPGELVLSGQLTMSNTGSAPATIGNVVVNLQSKQSSQWVTRSSDIADATSGDGATSASVVSSASSEDASSFSENAASGELEFEDAATNAPFSLVPQVAIGAGQTTTLLFQTSFDNAVLGLATGTLVRAEVNVSFGNAVTNAVSAPNIDINGNGVIDADEARVRSVASRLTLTVPTQSPSAPVTLTDTIDDITTTGTVTFSNAQFNLGTTSGTVTVDYDAGTSGGTITNCAHLTSQGSTVTSGGFTFQNIDGLDLLACSTQSIDAPPTCTPGAPGCGWMPGDVVTRDQFGWDTTTTWFGAYDTIYAATGGVVEVGIPGTAGFSMRFTAPGAIAAYFIAVGAAAALNADLVDPTTTSSGAFGGEVLALRLNVDFSAAGALGGTAGIAFGSIRLCNMTDPSLDGLTINDLLGIANTLLGGGSTGHSISALTPLLIEVNASFALAQITTFAQAHLVNGTCP